MVMSPKPIYKHPLYFTVTITSSSFIQSIRSKSMTNITFQEKPEKTVFAKFNGVLIPLLKRYFSLFELKVLLLS